MHKLTQCILVGGAARSGTTLLGYELGRYPSLIATPESRFLDAVLTGTVPSKAMERPERRAWNVSVRDLERIESRVGSVAELMAELLTIWARGVIDFEDLSDEVTWVDHTPGNVFRARRLAAEFEHPAVLFLLRDPRAVFASLRKVNWGPKGADATAQYWAACLAAAIRSEEALVTDGVMCRVVTYEALVRGPDTLCASIARWMSSDVRAASDSSLRLARHSLHDHPLLGKHPDVSRIDAWREELSTRCLRILEFRLWELMKAEGYEPRGRGDPPSDVQLFLDHLDDFVRTNLYDPLAWRWHASIGTVKAWARSVSGRLAEGVQRGSRGASGDR